MDQKITSQAFAKSLTANEIKIVKTRIKGVQGMGIIGYKFNTEFIGEEDKKVKEDKKVEEDPEGNIDDK